MTERSNGPFHTAIALLTSITSFLWRVAIWSWLEGVLERAVQRKLGGYRIRVNHIDTLRPAKRPADSRHKVAVIGGGLAGISAASHLAERGYDVTLYESNSELGGKLASWTHTFDDGVTVPMEHGFHAFFPNYYNLNRFLRRLGVEQTFRDTEDYRILTRDGGGMSFQGLHRTPGLNILHLALRGFFPVWETVVRNKHVERLNDMLNFHPVDTFTRLDDESYAHYADHAKLPSQMRLIFRSFTRVFFAESEQMSMAELVKSFHGFFLSHDGGLIYRYPTDDHATSLWAPIRAHLDALGVSVRLDHRVTTIERQKNGRLRVDNQPYDDVLLTTDLKTVRSLLQDASALVDDEAPELRAHIDAIQPANRYANLQFWVDTDVSADLPAFTSTERIRALDSITTKHRNERVWQDYVATHGGAVLELHCYSVPEAYDTRDKIRQALLDDLMVYCPELLGAQRDREVFYVKDDFSAFFTGMHAHRPGVASGVEGLWFAGDWVKLDIPVMLMENAFSSGLIAANAILARDGLREEPVYSVPLQGILYGIR